MLIRFIQPRPIALMLTALLVAAGGCTPMRNAQEIAEARALYQAGRYDLAQDILRPLARETNEDFVLNNLRLGSTYIADHKDARAEAAFLRAYEVINSYGTQGGGRSIGAVLVDEKIKIWKGEPFERAMANFYLGLLYYQQRDYANARGAFENALFKLRDYGADDEQAEEVESNFALASIMLGRTWLMLGREELAQANFQRARDTAGRHLDQLASTQAHAGTNVLLVVDYGYGPVKVTEFDGSIVSFSPTPAMEGPIPPPRVLVNGQVYPLEGLAVPPVDLLAVAQDRRWQSIDTIRFGKSAVGTGLIGAGAIMGARGAGNEGARQRTDLAVAAALIGSGLLLKATSQADTRTWEMLPRTTYLLPLRLPPGRHDVTVQFPGDGPHRTIRNLVAPAEKDATYYIRMQRWTADTIDWASLSSPGGQERPVAPGESPQGTQVISASP